MKQNNAQSFSYKSFIAFLICSGLFIVGSVSALFYFRIYPIIKARNERMEAEWKAEKAIELKRQEHDFLYYNLKYKYYRLRPSDEGRFFDCRWKSEDVIPQPFYAYPYLNFFGNRDESDNFTGISIINDWPSLLYISNIDRYNHHKSRILLGIRGSDYGIHKSNLPMEMLALIKRSEKYRDDLMFLPDNYVFIDANGSDIKHDRLQAACHNRTYNGDRYVGNTWTFFDRGAFWDRYDELFTNELYQNNENVFIFAYSNGSSPRYQLMKSRQIKKCEGDTMEDYENCHEFVDERAFRIKTIVDIETNYDYGNLKNTVMFINKNIRGKEGRYYYAICASKDCPIGNHEELIKLLELKPKPIKPGFVRYQDDTGRIAIDMINYQGPIFISHSSAIPFGIAQFEEISSR